MHNRDNLFEELLNAKSRVELRAAINSSGVKLSLPQIQKLLSHLNTLEPAVHTLSLGIIHTYTSDLLDPWLSFEAALQGLNLHTYHAPYGMILQEAQPNSGLVSHDPDITLLLFRREDLHPAFGKPVSSFDSQQQETLRKQLLERLRDTVGQFRAQVNGQILLTILPTMFCPGLGIYDCQSERSETLWWGVAKADIARCLRESMQASLFLDLDEILLQLGREEFFDFRFWYSARFPFTTAASREFARRIVALGTVIKYPKAKVIALDADNTLWGGVIGEDGINGIALGPDYPGNVYMDFQRRLLDFQQRGFILALCSKNNPTDVDQVLKEHPHQLLREEHFVARRINWLPKPDNLISLAAELNLGLDSFVLVDDSDYECAAVRYKLPQVEVIQTPRKAIEIPTCLERIARLEVLSITAEDLAKTQLYTQEHRRQKLKQELRQRGGDLRDYLASLDMKMQISFNDSTHISRLTQLTQKTNQFNLTTRRYNEQQLQEFILADDWLVAYFSLADVFGDSGIVGLALIHKVTSKLAKLDTFLMSCRVIGREAESAFLEALLRHLTKQGVSEVEAEYLPTPKNKLVEKFLPNQGFEKQTDGRYRRSLSNNPTVSESAFPISVELSV